MAYYTYILCICSEACYLLQIPDQVSNPGPRYGYDTGWGFYLPSKHSGDMLR